MATVSKGRTFVSGETVTPAKLNELVDNATVTAIQTSDISDSQVTTAKIADSAVTNAKIASGVDASKLTTGTLPADRIGSSAITTARINDAAVTPAKLSQPYTLDTAKSSTSGTSIDFTGIPSWARRITVMFNSVSTNGTSGLLLQVGTSSGVVSSGYSSADNYFNAGPGTFTSTAGFLIFATVTAAGTSTGHAYITLVDSNNWISSHIMRGGNNQVSLGAGNVSLAATLDRVRVTTVNGTDTFDAGTINIAYEG